MTKPILVFASNPSSGTLTRALEGLFEGIEVRIKSYFRPAKPWVVLKTAQRAGKGSGSDFFRGLPRLIWNNVIKKNLRTLFSDV